MSEILIDVTRLLIRAMEGRLPTGVDRVCLEYVRRFGPGARAALHRSRFGGVLSAAASQELFRLLLNPGQDFKIKAAKCLAASPPMPLSRRRHGGSMLFNIGHSGLERPSYAEWIRNNGLRPLFMVHDLIPITHPEYCRPGEKDKHIARMNTVLDTAAGIVTNSRATLDDLSAFAGLSGKSVPPAAVAHLAPAFHTAAEAPPPLPGPYFVMLGTIEPRKNHIMILHAWRRMAGPQGKAATPRLVIIGQRGWECENVIDLLERCEPLKGVVTELHDCPDTGLATWLAHARALLFPSFTEGYGIPLVESLATGTPAIASDLGVFREITGNLPDYLDPLDGPGWIERIEEYSKPESSKRTAQMERLKGYSPPTWDTHFKAVEELLEQIG